MRPQTGPQSVLSSEGVWDCRSCSCAGIKLLKCQQIQTSLSLKKQGQHCLTLENLAKGLAAQLWHSSCSLDHELISFHGQTNPRQTETSATVIVPWPVWLHCNFFFFFFFCVPQLYLWGSPLLGEIFAYVIVF